MLLLLILCVLVIHVKLGFDPSKLMNIEFQASDQELTFNQKLEPYLIHLIPNCGSFVDCGSSYPTMGTEILVNPIILTKIRKIGNDIYVGGYTTYNNDDKKQHCEFNVKDISDVLMIHKIKWRSR